MLILDGLMPESLETIALVAQLVILSETILNVAVYATMAIKLKNFLRENFNKRFDNQLSPIMRVSLLLCVAAAITLLVQGITFYYFTK